MQRTRITAKVLATVAVAAVSGCVSVDSGPSPAPAAPEASRLANQDVAPQILEGPAREALEAALPPPSAPAAPPAPSPPPGEPSRAPAAALPTAPPGTPGADLPARIPAAPERLREQLPRVQPTDLPSVPATVPDVCALGRSHGGWDPDSRQAQLCREAYGH